MAWNTGRNKFGNKPVVIDGHKFPSELEAQRYVTLKLMTRKGYIHDLQLQVRFNLIPVQRDPDSGKLAERACDYIADFVYKDRTGATHVEDAKGFKTPEYIIKRKLMMYRYGIRIEEISNGKKTIGYNRSNGMHKVRFKIAARG